LVFGTIQSSDLPRPYSDDWFWGLTVCITNFVLNISIFAAGLVFSPVISSAKVLIIWETPGTSQIGRLFVDATERKEKTLHQTQLDQGGELRLQTK
jgi:hypothetical protein